MRLVVLALSLFSAAVFAGSSRDQLLGSIGRASLSDGVVEVPPISSPNGQTTPHVRVQIGDTSYLKALTLDSDNLDAFVALSEIYAAQGHSEKSRKWRTRAAQSVPLNSGHALRFIE